MNRSKMITVWQVIFLHNKTIAFDAETILKWCLCYDDVVDQAWKVVYVTAATNAICNSCSCMQLAAAAVTAVAVSYLAIYCCWWGPSFFLVHWNPRWNTIRCCRQILFFYAFYGRPSREQLSRRFFSRCLHPRGKSSEERRRDILACGWYQNFACSNSGNIPLRRWWMEIARDGTSLGIFQTIFERSIKLLGNSVMNFVMHIIKI